jgi:hypothetical protein
MLKEGQGVVLEEKEGSLDLEFIFPSNSLHHIHVLVEVIAKH